PATAHLHFKFATTDLRHSTSGTGQPVWPERPEGQNFFRLISVYVTAPHRELGFGEVGKLSPDVSFKYLSEFASALVS
ncbi:MAG: hypothetical protein AB8B85_21455, partial [Paracoccaceae bacterium]